MKRLVILGASGHGRVVADIAAKIGYTEIVFRDDNTALKSCGKYPVIGPAGGLSPQKEEHYFVAIGNAAIRERLQSGLAGEGAYLPVLIHPSAVIAEEVSLGEGTVVMAGAVVNPGAAVGSGCIVNTGATVDHDCRIGDYCHISVGSHLAGTVTIGRRTWVGIGAVISNNIDVCSDCMIGAGAVVIGDLRDPGTYVGVPAGKIKD